MRIKLYILMVLVVLVFSRCNRSHNSGNEAYKPNKLETIKQNGVLRVVTDYNSTSYFIYRGQPMGYQFELLQELADYLDVKLEVIANNNLEQKFEMLEKAKLT